jgi:hypothetical protein
VPHSQSPPSAYLRLNEAHLTHDRTAFGVSLICDDGYYVQIAVQVTAEFIPLLVPYLILLQDSSTHPYHTEPPVVPVLRGDSGVWTFDHAAALRDQEPIPPEPDATALPSPPPLFCFESG